MTHPHIPTKPVKSSSIKAVGYDPETETLAIHWKNDAVYHYAKVPEKTYAALKEADSVGVFVMKNIIPRHKHTKIE